MINLTLEEQERHAYMAGDTTRAALCGDTTRAALCGDLLEELEDAQRELAEAEGTIGLLEDELRDADRENSRLREELEALS